MLLKALYDFAHQRNLLDDLAFAQKPVRWIIELDKNGRFLGIVPTQTDNDKRGNTFPCPQTSRAKNGAGVAEFLSDGLIAVFGLDPDPEAIMSRKTRLTRDANNLAKRANFWRQMRRSMRDSKSPYRLAVLRCWKLTRSSKQIPDFLRLGLSAATKSDEKNSWWLTTAGGIEAKLGNENFTFRIDHTLLLEVNELKGWWRRTHAQEQSDLREESRVGSCLVTADLNVPLARNHKPLISGVPGAGAMGTIVSFESASFTSYGLEKSLNAPTSIAAAQAYGVALNELLSRRDHHLKTGGMCIIFWAKNTSQVSSAFARFFDQPQPQAVRNLITSPSKGFLNGEWIKDDEFYAITLTGNKGRIAVKQWMRAPLASVIENLRQWFIDLDVVAIAEAESKLEKGKPKGEVKDFSSPLSIYWLSRTILSDEAAKKLEKNLPPSVPSLLYRAALEGSAPPISMIKPILSQIHSRIVSKPKEGKQNYRVIWDQSRFALLKLILNRHHRSRNELTMQLESKLTTDTPDPAYNCGRLLSVFDNLQRTAHQAEAGGASKLNTTLAERYFGAAASNPNGAFSLMWRLHMHHLKKIRQKGEPGQKTAAAFQRSIMEICRYFKASTQDGSPQFPRVFTLVQQGRFALGYYQQEAERAERIRLWMERKKAEGKLPPDADEQEIDLDFDDEDQN